MNAKTPRPVSRAIAAALVAACACGAAGLAQAENHALILWIGSYANPDVDLPGIDLDARNARRIAVAMGVPERNITELSNQALIRPRFGDALRSLTDRIAQDDRVFIYYSGHGTQITSRSGAKCTEGLVAHDLGMYEDTQLEQALKDLGAKASQVVMMNDSCFSGGAATKQLKRSSGGAVAKFYAAKADAVVDDERQCGTAVNKMTRNLEAVATIDRPPQVLYIAASAANEVSYATRDGSLATQAWAQCITQGDSNGSGVVDGEELRACSQRLIGSRQTVTLVGNQRLPLTFVSQSGGASGPVNPLRSLEDVRNARDRSMSVHMTTSTQRLRIGKDLLNFTVTTDREGYLYVLQAGSDGKTFNLLFPNKTDDNNYLRAGTHAMPRPSWRVRPGGPAGTGYLMAVVSETRKDLKSGMDLVGTFAGTEANSRAVKVLFDEATGAGGRGGGRFGASEIVAIQEVD